MNKDAYAENSISYMLDRQTAGYRLRHYPDNLRGGKMEIRCKNTYSKQFGILTGCVVTEPDGTRREICPLFYGKMIRKYKGRFFYAKDMPVDYFEKAKNLEDNGWSTWYHYNNWINSSVKNPEHEGYSTDEAIKKCLTTAST